MPLPAATSVAGTAMAAAGAGKRQDASRSQHSGESEPFFSVDGSLGPRVMARPHCFFDLSILPPLGPGCGTFMEVGIFLLGDLKGEPENTVEVTEREELWKAIK